MKRQILILCTMWCALLAGHAQEKATLHYLTFHDGQLVVIPDTCILGRTEENGQVSIALKGDTVFTFAKSNLACEDTQYNGSLPQLESFKFNNKFNDQLYTDALGTIDHEAGRVDLTVGCIGKRLTPSFQLPEGAKAYIGSREQLSKVTRRRFDKPVTYTVAYPNNWIYRIEKIGDEVWSTPPESTEEPWIITPLTLSSEMLSSNWPSQQGSDWIGNLLDGDVNTYFHSDWSASNDWREGAVYGDGTCTWPYLQIDMCEEVENLQFSYTTRNSGSHNGYAPQGFIILASHDGMEWEEVTTISQDRLPVGAAQTFFSPVINLGKAYRLLRLQLTASSRKNYLVMSEFSLNRAEANPDYGKDVEDFVPELIAPAQYRRAFMPFGTDYEVHVNYLADQPTGEYSVPRIDITFADGVSWNSSVWIGRYGKEFWEEATIKIDGGGVFPDMEEDSILIRGRGNSSWAYSWYSKNPYRIKFPVKTKPFGMTKGKNWVLLANKQAGSLTTNAIAMKVADMVKSAACNHIIPVELYVNGHYRGSYNFTEKIGFAGNSIDLDDETNAVLLELDSYWDEVYKFKSMYYNQPVNIKEPDFADPETVTNLTFDQIQTMFGDFTYQVKENTYPTYMDVDAFCRAMLATDLTRNTEVQHPKSWYVYNENLNADSAWVFGPVWDFDWSFGYEGHGQYFVYDAQTDLFNYGNAGIPFFRQMLRGNEVVKRHYYKVWTEFLQNGKLDELIEYCDEYFTYANPSFEHNATQWGDGNGYSKVNDNAKKWLTQRAEYVYSNLTKYDLGDDIIYEGEGDEIGQPVRIDMAMSEAEPVDVFTLKGIRVRTHVPYYKCMHGLMPGIYVVKGRKVVVR